MCKYTLGLLAHSVTKLLATMATQDIISSPLVVLLLLLLMSFTAGADATVFFVQNQGTFMVWAPAMPVTNIHEVGGAELTPEKRVSDGWMCRKKKCPN